MNRKTTLGLVLALLLQSELIAQHNYTISGKVENIDNPQWIYLSEDWKGEEMIDSVKVRNGRFRYKGKTRKPYPTMATLYLSYKDGKASGKLVRRLLTDFFMEKGKISVTIHGLGFRDGTSISGTKVNEDYLAYRKLKDTHLKQRQRRLDALEDARPHGQAAMDDYREGIRQMGTGFATANPASFFSLFLLEADLLPVSTPDQLLAVFNQLSPALRKSEKGVLLFNKISNAAAVKVGAMAPGFTEKDTLGSAVALSSFKGKYVLIDFWASWCRPCREEHPYLIEAYQQFKEKDFTILSVSLDNSRNAWMKAIQKDGLLWQQVSALDPENSESAIRYGVKTIPRNFLIDPTGKIIAMDLRGKALIATLEAIF